MPAGPIYLNTQSLNKILELSQAGRFADNALVVPYGEGKFYLATRQSKVAAFLPTFLNRLLKLTVPNSHEKAMEAYEAFAKAVEESRKEAGTSGSQKQPNKLPSGRRILTLGHAATMINRLNADTRRVKTAKAREEALMKGQYAVRTEQVIKNAKLPFPAGSMAEEYLPNLRAQFTHSLKYSDKYMEILKEVSKPDRLEPITKKDELVYELRLATMLGNAREAGLFPPATGRVLGREGIANVIKEIARLAAYQTFDPDAADGKELAKRLTQGANADKNTMEGWKAVIKTGQDVAELS